MNDLPVLPVIYALRFVEMMREEGLDSDGVLRDSGISPNLINRPDSLLTLQQMRSLIHHYVGLSSTSLPALRYGMRLDLISHGLLGHVFFWRGEFRELIETIAAYLRVRLPLVNIELTQGSDYFGIRLSPRISLGEAESFLLQTFMASLRTLAGPVIRNIVIHCRHDFFYDITAAQNLLKVSIRNDNDVNEMRFYSAGVKIQEAGDSASAPASKPDPYQEHGFVVRLRGQLLNEMRGDQSAEAIASAMGMSVRTMRRRLDECGMSFNQIRLDVRMQVAMRYLTTTAISLAKIADYVGYGDQASFTRAFREWSGETPNTVRQRRMKALTGTSSALTDEDSSVLP